MAGLAAARMLRLAGIEPLVFEKSRGLGGRMATRRAGSHEFDHGAQFFSAKGEGFRTVVAEWCAVGAAGSWGTDRYVGKPRMTAPGPRVEAAFDSGVAMAHVVAQSLERA